MQNLPSTGLAVLILGFCAFAIAQNSAKEAAENNPPTSSATTTVKYFPSNEVQASFEKSSPLIDHAGRNYSVIPGKRDKSGVVELHEKDTDVYYVVDGTATYVTGGKIIDSKSIAPGEVRGSAIEGGLKTRKRKLFDNHPAETNGSSGGR